MLAPLRERADYVIDTSNLSTAKLKGELRRLFAKSGSAQGRMDVRVSSFGFKYGIPMEADLVFDVRFLPNPYYVAELRPMTGLDAPVRDYVFQSRVTDEFLPRLGDFVGWLLPRYEERARPPWWWPWAVPGGTTGPWPWPTPWPIWSAGRASLCRRATGTWAGTEHTGRGAELWLNCP